jgi:hypothetical protein
MLKITLQKNVITTNVTENKNQKFSDAQTSEDELNDAELIAVVGGFIDHERVIVEYQSNGCRRYSDGSIDCRH